MLKAKQMPKKKQTKQTKKPVKNDGKITKKKYIKTKIIGGGKMIQMLTLKEKLEYLKDCLVNATNATTTYKDYFKDLKITDSVSHNIKLKEYHHEYSIEDITSFDNCLKMILLCLSDHDEYNSYALLYEKFQVFNNKRKEGEKIQDKFETVAISEEKKKDLLTKSDSYFEKYKKCLDNFIEKIISVADTNGEPEEQQEALERVKVEEEEVEGEVAGRVEGEGGVEERVGGVEGEGGVEERVGGVEGEVRQRGDLFGIPFTQKKITPDEKEKKFFETGMFQIYSEGILLLTIDDESRSNHTLQVFNKSVNSVNVTLNKSEKIIEFFNNKKEILIIRRYNSLKSKSDYYELECRIQLMYKLVNILLDDDNIRRYENALKEQLETNLKK